MLNQLKKNRWINALYRALLAFGKAYMPITRARLAYWVTYRKALNLKHPTTFSEKLLWLSFHTYRNNPQIMRLSDKFFVRPYVTEVVGDHVLNPLLRVYEDLSDIRWEDLPSSFALKISQGCKTNLLVEDKAAIQPQLLSDTLQSWGTGQRLYDREMANIGGIALSDYKKVYVLEPFLSQPGEASPIDYKFYCFNGEPKAILVIQDRFGHKKGLFMSLDWQVLSHLTGSYQDPSGVFERPKGLEQMIEVAKKLSQPFPFVRVDLYDLDGRVVFGELTFFPNGCIGMQETVIDGKTMGEWLDLSSVMNLPTRAS
jgi:hypothetical protein